jgi:hypothetical protein
MLLSNHISTNRGRHDPDTVLAEDYDYWIRVARKYPMYHISEPLYYYREHSQTLTQTKLHEIGVASLLVKAKNHLVTQAAKNHFAYLCRKKRPKFYGARFLFNFLVRMDLMRKIGVLDEIRLRKRIRFVLLDYESGQLRFKAAKQLLLQIT